jgi:hypothetical protein
MKVTVYALEAKVHGINFHDDNIACDVPGLGYDAPILVSTDNDKITCEECKMVLIRNYVPKTHTPNEICSFSLGRGKYCLGIRFDPATHDPKCPFYVKEKS